ncbi:hypothetical protein AOQ84DRAFT_440128 [Glonium stellatum]|uniref:Uncharacterized protein n=1 Tax=Glonium stellatum TaxID=574774 RepID=A0A8E2EZI9_9PEZI|nr:hypothetical protein AOQ84DRAFT_440128 [Glonium stellatum]
MTDTKMDPKGQSDSTLEKCISKAQGETEETSLTLVGLAPETSRDIGSFAIIALGWDICNSWVGVAATMALSIASGGSVTLVYGIIVILVTVGCSAATLSEIASVYPTAGGQYHWTSILSPKAVSRGLLND